jgi:hypothetical protein
LNNKKLSFAVENITPVDDSSLDKSQFALLRVDAFATGRSLHDTFTTEENLRRNAPTILQKPFLAYLDKRWDDLGGHDKGEHPMGFVPHNSRLEFKTLDDGRVMLSCDVLVWRRYSQDLIRYFQRDGGKKGVSVEISISESQEDHKSGLLELISYVFEGITCLGDMIRSAIPNAEAVMAFSKQFEEDKQEFEEQFSDKYSDLDMTIPKSVKRSAIKSLELRKERGKGGTAESLGVARHLSRNEKTSVEKIKTISKFFSRKNVYDDLVIGLYGGRSSKRWSSELMSKIQEIDNTRVSYFSGEETENDESSFEDDSTKKEDILVMGKKKEEVKVEELEKEIEMAAPETPEKEEKPTEEMAAPSEKEETPEEEKKESPEEEKKEQEDKTEMAAPSDEKPEEKEEPKEEEEFSFGFDHAVAMSLFADDSEDEKKAKEEFAKKGEADSKVLMSGMFAAMCRMSEFCKGMSEKMAALESFKAGIEEQKKNFAVDSTIKELTGKFEIPEETVKEMREESAKFEFAQIDGWMNFAKAKAVDFPVIVPKNGKEEVVRIGLPFPAGTGFAKNNSPWEARK